MNQKQKKGNIWTITRKEFARFFGDKRMAFTTILLPGLIIYAMYSVMGTAIKNMHTVSDDFKANVYVQNPSEIIGQVIDETEMFTIHEVKDDAEAEAIREEITDKDSDKHLLVIFPENFDEEMKAYQSSSGKAAPNVEIYYNSASTKGNNTYNAYFGILDGFEDSMTNKFDVNRLENPEENIYDVATKEDSSRQMFASMLPMLMMIFLFSGCMGVAPESIAGEKERGTIATLLITPMKRSQLAIGKIIALGVIALLSGFSSFLGTFLSLPKLMGVGGDMSVSYSVTEYALLFGVIISTVMVIIGMICVISTYAKSVKEAGTLITPLMLISMVVGITSMFGNGAPSQAYMYCIPLYNSVQSMTAIFLGNFTVTNILITIVANLVVMGLCAFGMTKMFNSEKIVFNK